MGSSTERSFLTSLLGLDADAPAAETVQLALRALMVLTRARYGRAEILVRGEAHPLALATFDTASAHASDSADNNDRRADVMSDVFETGFATARLELRSRRAGVDLTFRERHLFDLLFQAMSRLAQRAHFDAGVAGLHEATRDFQAKLVANALQRAHGNVARAARELQVTRAFVYKLLRAGRKPA
ncbi:MAG: helix-turn-helix domain-containing protein [Polyangiales bacterium]